MAAMGLGKVIEQANAAAEASQRAKEFERAADHELELRKLALATAEHLAVHGHQEDGSYVIFAVVPFAEQIYQWLLTGEIKR